MPKFYEMSNPLDSVFNAFNDKQEQEHEQIRDYLAKMIVLARYKEEFIEKKDDKKMINLKEFDERVKNMKEDPVFLEVEAGFHHKRKDMHIAIQNIIKAAQRKGYSEHGTKLWAVSDYAQKLDQVYHKIDKDIKLEEEKQKKKLEIKKEFYDPISDKIGPIINGGVKLPLMKQIVAMCVAFNELKGKGEGVDDQHVKMIDYDKRYAELLKDPDNILFKTAQTLCGLEMQEKMQKKFASSKQQGKDFADMVSAMYAQNVAEKQQAAQNKKDKQSSKGMGIK